MSVMLPSLTVDFVPLNLFYFVDQEPCPSCRARTYWQCISYLVSGPNKYLVISGL